MQYRLITLLAVVPAVAIVLALVFRQSALEKALRNDLNLPATGKMWILEKDEPNQVLAVVQVEDRYKIFVAYRGWLGQTGEMWEIPFIVGSGAPPDQPEAVWEATSYYDAYPTEKQIADFRRLWLP